ncbi:hypothetical protein TNCV_2226561 [Trichonephila clavipes]|nr:hypothetical protein TNCV_2226561 [Trichonephila clavipes]
MATGSSVTQNYSRSQSEVLRDLHNLTSPPHIADPSPIENVWDMGKTHIRLQSPFPSYLQNLKSCIDT